MEPNERIFISEKNFRSRYEYTNADLLGEGGFAQVYKAYDRQFKDHVALKFYNKGEQGKYDVLHEMKNSRMFSHKNIIRVCDAFVVKFEHTGTDSYVQIGVLEFANGGNLRDFIRTKPSENQFIDVLIGILSALDYLHKDKKIIHRDLSPENILMYKEDDQWIPKITDFGISKKINTTPGQDDKKSTQLLGKVDYMAPEQFDPEKFGINGKLNTNIDLWAFGIILYELFTHEKPFGKDSTTDNPVKVIQSITRDSIQDLEEIPNPYRGIIKKCLVKHAKKRVHDGKELIDVLEKYQKSKSEWGLGKTTRKKRRGPLKYIGYGAITLLALSILLVSGYYFVGWQNNRLLQKHQLNLQAMMTNKEIDRFLSYYQKLPIKYQLDGNIVTLFVKAERIKTSIDSLHTQGNAYFSNQQFERALEIYNKIIVSYYPDDQLAMGKINIINYKIDSINHPEKWITSSTKVPGDIKKESTSEIKESVVDAAFTANVTSGTSPLSVRFTDQSTGEPTSWEWDFNNDGIVDSKSKSPKYTYRRPGNYAVKLTTKNGTSNDNKVINNFIKVIAPKITAKFTANIRSGEQPLAVQFTDQSSGNPTSWDWDFDNNGTIDATAQNPRKKFNQAGIYSVKLTAKSKSADDQVIRYDFIKVTRGHEKFSVRRISGDDRTILKAIKFTDNNTVIYLDFLPGEKPVLIHPVGSEGAFYISYNNKKSTGLLKDIKGVNPGIPEKLINKRTVELVFEKLPAEVKNFNLLEGTDQLDESVIYRNFIGIKLE